jgi:hypothetical protein
MISFEPEGAFFRPWRDTVPAFEYLPGVELHQIVVPTVDTARFSLLSRRLIATGRSVYIGGPSGCGKTVLLSQLMGAGDANGSTVRAGTPAVASAGGAAAGSSDDAELASPGGVTASVLSSTTTTAAVTMNRVAAADDGSNAVFAVSINFSGRSTSSVTQRTIESRLLKRHGTALGPPVGTKVRAVT